MQFGVIQRILGLMLSLFSLTMLPPLLIAVLSNDGTATPFITALLLVLIVGISLWFPVRHIKNELRLRDGFIVVVVFWVGLGLAGAIPFVLSSFPVISLTDAVFESISGLTTTGATVITGIDALPRSILFYRQELQWLGGMGIIVLAVAILPMLGIGGMQLYRAETPGPVKDTKLTPRITETAKALWYIYLTLTILCAVSYWLAGMSLFDAISHSFSTVSIGGFSTHDLSIGYFDNKLIDAVAVSFMLISGINFTLHFISWNKMSLRAYWQDTEVKTYINVLMAISIICCFYLIYEDVYPDYATALTHGIFQTVSITTTTGYGTVDYQTWSPFAQMLVFALFFVGGSAGSTGGGIKVIRILVLFKQGRREIRRLIHPNAVIIIKLGNKPLPEDVINAIWGFFASYVAVFAIIMLLIMATGLDQVTAFSATAACINNPGPGLGDVSAHYGDLNNTAKWLLTMAMLLGRLEIFTLLVLFTPTFWRK